MASAVQRPNASYLAFREMCPDLARVLEGDACSKLAQSAWCQGFITDILAENAVQKTQPLSDGDRTSMVVMFISKKMKGSDAPNTMRELLSIMLNTNNKELVNLAATMSQLVTAGNLEALVFKKASSDFSRAISGQLAPFAFEAFNRDILSRDEYNKVALPQSQSDQYYVYRILSEIEAVIKLDGDSAFDAFLSTLEKEVGTSKEMMAIIQTMHVKRQFYLGGNMREENQEDMEQD